MVKIALLVMAILVCLFLFVAVFHQFNEEEPDSSVFQGNIVTFEKVDGVNLSFFDVYQLNESLGQTAHGLVSADFNKNGLLDFAVSYGTSPFTHSTISLFFSQRWGNY